MNIEKVLINVAYCINLVIPKRSNQVFFYSMPDYSDNARAVYEKMLQLGLTSKYRIIWAVKDEKKYQSLLKNVVVVRHRSLRNLWHFCRSKYIFRTHSLWGNKYVSGRQKMCVVWHGMPLKKLLFLPGKKAEKLKCDVLTSTTAFFDKELSESLGLPKEACKHVGLPRNDELFVKGNELNEKYPGFKKKIIWMPTFRNNQRYCNGIDTELGLPCVERKDLERLNEVLEKHNYLLILKLHSWSADKLDGIRYGNIVNLKDADIGLNCSLYKLLGQTDALITDYSSVYIDYLLTDHPICFVYNDIKEYRETRGFAYEPAESIMPGAHVQSFEELLSWIDRLEKEDPYLKERNDLKRRFFDHPDQHSSERVLEAMGIK